MNNDRLEKQAYELDNVRETFESLQELATYDRRIRSAENEAKMLQRTVNQHIIDMNANYSLFVSQRKVEETILKFNFNLLDSLFGDGNFDPEEVKNYDIQAQLKINFSKWKEVQKYKFDLGTNCDEPAIYSIYNDVQLPLIGPLRKAALQFEMFQAPLMINTAPKLN